MLTGNWHKVRSHILIHKHTWDSSGQIKNIVRTYITDNKNKKNYRMGNWVIASNLQHGVVSTQWLFFKSLPYPQKAAIQNLCVLVKKCIFIVWTGLAVFEQLSCFYIYFLLLINPLLAMSDFYYYSCNILLLSLLVIKQREWRIPSDETHPQIEFKPSWSAFHSVSIKRELMNNYAAFLYSAVFT